jgi:hypothetical protein
MARVSMPVLNPMAGFSRGFDDYKLMKTHNDFAGMVAEVDFAPDTPVFLFCNIGETHYPYMLTDADLPRISGLHGVVKGMDDLIRSGGLTKDEGAFFSSDMMARLHDQQVRCVEYVDGLIGDLMDKAPSNTYFIVTADHGELFGEDDYFGHGPIMHPKVFEVPFVEGLRP